MKLVTVQSLKRIQFLMWGKRIWSSTGSSPAAVAIDGRRRKVALVCFCSRSYVPKKWVHKFKAQWKKAIGWHKSSSPQYSYDIHSYSLNFDEGRLS
ncbi:hypothetical protein LINGRAHAP2_LOCUS4071 [Linum grandiflorum]